MATQPVFCDATGLTCPMPVLRARRALESLPHRAQLELHATDPMTAIDLPHFCTQTGHKLLSHEEQQGVLIFLIEKVAKAEAAD